MLPAPSVTRTILFIRHGQYSLDPVEQLTLLGAEQARLTATALSGLEVDKMFASTMPRAEQTAEILAKELKVPVAFKKFLCECHLPARGLEQPKLQMRANKKVVDEAFDFLFKPPARGHSTHVVVSHGNVIRYWACRALKMDVLDWLNMDIHQCSVTTLRVDNSGRIKLLGFSDIGHIPRSKRTYS